VSRINSDPAVAAGLSLAYVWKIEDDSDHFPFIEAGVPTLMFHTGLHDQYHRPSDDAHLVNLDGIEPVARLALGVVREIADADRSAVFRDACRGESDTTRRLLESPAPLAPGAPRGRWGLGTRPDPGEPTAAVVVRVVPDSPAAAAGVLVGDRIVAIDGGPVPGHDEMLERLRAAAGQVTITVDRAGLLTPTVMRETEAAGTTR